MGYDLEFDKRGEAEPVPEDFTMRWEGRQRFVSIIWDIPHDEVSNCACAGSKHDYFCDAVESVRPKDFAQFRTELEKEKLLLNEDGTPSVFSEIADYLERNSNVYMNGSW